MRFSHDMESHGERQHMEQAYIDQSTVYSYSPGLAYAEKILVGPKSRNRSRFLLLISSALITFFFSYASAVGFHDFFGCVISVLGFILINTLFHYLPHIKRAFSNIYKIETRVMLASISFSLAIFWIYCAAHIPIAERVREIILAIVFTLSLNIIVNLIFTLQYYKRKLKEARSGY